MNSRDQEYIDNRLMNAGPATEACERLRKNGRADLADEVMAAAQVYTDRLRAVRYKLAGQPVTWAEEEPTAAEFTPANILKAMSEDDNLADVVLHWLSRGMEDEWDCTLPQGLVLGFGGEELRIAARTAVMFEAAAVKVSGDPAAAGAAGVGGDDE